MVLTLVDLITSMIITRALHGSEYSGEIPASNGRFNLDDGQQLSDNHNQCPPSPVSLNGLLGIKMTTINAASTPQSLY